MNVDINQYMEVIVKYARVGCMHMKKPSTFDLDDMIQEGCLVFFKDAIRGYSETGKAAFKSYLITCLRNHFVGMMSKSFRSSKESDAKYTLNRLRRMAVISPMDAVVSSITVEELFEKLNDEEIEYANLLWKHEDGKTVRRILGISKYKERKLRKCISEKILK